MESFKGILCNRFVNWITIKKRYWINGKYIKYIDIKWFERIKQENCYEIEIIYIYIAAIDDYKLGWNWTLFNFIIQDKKIITLCLFGLEWERN